MTPAWTVRAILGEIWQPSFTWLDPCAGNGDVLHAIACFSEARGESVNRRAWDLHGIEKDALRTASARAAIGANIRQRDALDCVWREGVLKGADLAIVADPPRRLATSFVAAALAEKPLVAAFLMPIEWLGGEKRATLHKGYPADIYVLSRKVAREGVHAWFVWGRTLGGSWKVLGPERCSDDGA